MLAVGYSSRRSASYRHVSTDECLKLFYMSYHVHAMVPEDMFAWGKSRGDHVLDSGAHFFTIYEL